MSETIHIAQMSDGRRFLFIRKGGRRLPVITPEGDPVFFGRGRNPLMDHMIAIMSNPEKMKVVS